MPTRTSRNIRANQSSARGGEQTASGIRAAKIKLRQVGLSESVERVLLELEETRCDLEDHLAKQGENERVPTSLQQFAVIARWDCPPEWLDWDRAFDLGHSIGYLSGAAMGLQLDFRDLIAAGMPLGMDDPDDDSNPGEEPVMTSRVFVSATSHLLHIVAVDPERSQTVLEELADRAESEYRSDYAKDNWAGWFRREAALALSEEILRIQGLNSWQFVDEIVTRIEHLRPKVVDRAELRAWSAIRRGTPELDHLICEELLDALPLQETAG